MMKKLGLLTIILLALTSVSFGQNRQEVIQNCYDAVNKLLFDETSDKEFAWDTVWKCDKAIQIDSGIANLFEGRGVAYLKYGMHWSAIRDFERALLIEKKSSRTLAFQGEAYRMIKWYDDSLSHLNSALQINPTNLYALYQRALVHQAKNDKASAIKDLQEILKIHSSDEKAKKLLAELQITANETKVLNINQYDIKGCINLRFSENLIKSQTHFLKAIRNDASRKKCLQDLEKLDFEKTSLFGVNINSGYCRTPVGLKFTATKDAENKAFVINISYIKPNGICRALSSYDLWVVLPKPPGDYLVRYKITELER